VRHLSILFLHPTTKTTGHRPVGTRKMLDYCRLAEVLKGNALSDTIDEIAGLRRELGLGERDNQQLN
jgi:hypothetical protein